MSCPWKKRFKFLKIIVKSQSQTSRFWCYTMLEIIVIAMSISIIVTTLLVTSAKLQQQAQWPAPLRGLTIKGPKVQSYGYAASCWAACLSDFSSVSRHQPPWQVPVTGVRWRYVYQQCSGHGRRHICCDFFHCTAQLRQFACIPGDYGMRLIRKCL